MAYPKADSLWLLIISGIFQAAKRQYLTIDGSRAGFIGKEKSNTLYHEDLKM